MTVNTEVWLETIDQDPRLGTAEHTAALAHATGAATAFDDGADARAHLLLTVAGYLRPIAIDGPEWWYEATLPAQAAVAA